MNNAIMIGFGRDLKCSQTETKVAANKDKGGRHTGPKQKYSNNSEDRNRSVSSSKTQKDVEDHKHACEKCQQGCHKGDWVFKKYFKISNRSFSTAFFILDKSPTLSLLFPNTPTQHQKPSF
mmetsp:Transcript_65299/g.96575  ORF Transcript_65299/g.96575 Transcript_65299/m.96575 type:complete len:121 (-) Transcript_65299:2173-2535(-)